jgi:hypothetical protein
MLAAARFAAQYLRFVIGVLPSRLPWHRCWSFDSQGASELIDFVRSLRCQGD